MAQLVRVGNGGPPPQPDVYTQGIALTLPVNEARAQTSIQLPRAGWVRRLSASSSSATTDSVITIAVGNITVVSNVAVALLPPTRTERRAGGVGQAIDVSVVRSTVAAEETVYLALEWMDQVEVCNGCA